jgi:hypothetical protein
MPFIIQGRRGGRLIAAVTAAFALTATPALATTGVPVLSTAAGCDTPMAQAFAFAGDKSDYVLAPGGNFEGSLAGWTLTGGAQAVTGSAPAVSGAKLGARSLRIPAGGSATTALMCVSAHSPYFRFQARNGGTGSLKVEMVVLDGPRVAGVKDLGTITAGGAWAPTSRISIAQGILGVNGISDSQATVSFRFTPVGIGGSWQVDDVYLDPYRKF